MKRNRKVNFVFIVKFPYAIHISHYLLDAKKQILANLANFAYDPINYEYFRRLQIIPLFLDAISSSTDETIIYFSSAGLCNLCLGMYFFFLASLTIVFLNNFNF